MSTKTPSYEMLSVPLIALHHLTEEVANRLEAEGDDNPWCRCAVYKYGLILDVSEMDLDEDIPQCLLDLRRWSQDQQTSFWVMLEASGLPQPDLPLYEWI
ncbi:MULTISPECIES: hypothetical protein [unclassified Pseudomonas]|uniref:DUF5983 family protein n=1 Tax=unclassified Pseudomonas TaxID=196821 RepID=UPI002579A12E|nr:MULTISPECIES: hypothetical protein [unclassified Pseudomonas]